MIGLINRLIWNRLKEIKIKINMEELQNLNLNNFYSICDVAWDINEKLQMTTKEELSIPFWKNSVSFPLDVLHTRPINQKSIHKDGRRSALNYMMDKGYIKTFFDERCGDFKEFVIRLDRVAFNNFFNLLKIAFEKRQLIKKKSSDENVSLFPQRIPRNTSWQNVTIKFKDKEKVSITIKGITDDTDYEKMGFSDKRTGKTNYQWGLLLLFAKNNGELKPANPQIIESMKKQVSLLAQKLQTYIPIDYDPFYPYEDSSDKRGFFYKIKLSLIYSEEIQIKPDATVDDDIADLIKEQTSRI